MKKFQVKTKWNEKPTKIKPQAYGVQFVLANYYFSWGLLWGVFDTPGDAPPGKMDFPFLGRYLLQTAPWTEVGPSPIQHLDLSGVNLVSSYACCHSLYGFRCQSVLLFLEDTLPWIRPSPLALTISVSLPLQRSLSIIGEESEDYIPLRQGAPKSLSRCACPIVISVLLILVFCKQRLWWGLSNTLWLYLSLSKYTHVFISAFLSMPISIYTSIPTCISMAIAAWH